MGVFGRVTARGSTPRLLAQGGHVGERGRVHWEHHLHVAVGPVCRREAEFAAQRPGGPAFVSSSTKAVR